METVLSKAGLKVLDIVEIVRQPKGFPDLLGKTGRITEYEGEDKCVVDLGGSHPLYVIEISTLRRLDPSDPQPEDEVNSPSHYTHGGIECIDSIQASMSKEEFEGYCKGNAQKYLWRWRHKGGRQSLEKAAWYLNKLLEVVE